MKINITINSMISKIKKMDIKKLDSFIIKNLLEDNLLDKILKNLFVSRTTLHRKIVRETGVSISKHIMKIRLEIAFQLLKENTVYQTAIKTGFSSVSYFSKSFQKKYGHRPSEVYLNQ